MAMLGDILAAARRSAAGIERWLADARPELLARIADAASAEGETIGSFVRIAVADFARDAPEEEWATLTSRLRGSEEPGATCLIAMLEWHLAASEAAFSPDASTEKEHDHA